jgi:hypothetical protein
MRTSPDSRNPNPWTESTVTIASVRIITGVGIWNCPIVSSTQVSEPTLSTANTACQRRSDHASSRQPSSNRTGLRFPE